MRFSKMSVETSAMPYSSSLKSWLGQELETRGIDAVIYTRYILSILQQDNFDIDTDELEQDPFTIEKPIKPKKMRRFRGEIVDSEKLKKNAAVQCLMSVSEEDSTTIELLVEELYKKLKQQKSKKLVPPVIQRLRDAESSNDSTSDTDHDENYFSAFPPLNLSNDSSPTHVVSEVTWIEKPHCRTLWSNMLTKEKLDMGEDSSSEAKVTTSTSSLNTGREKYKSSRQSPNKDKQKKTTMKKGRSPTAQDKKTSRDKHTSGEVGISTDRNPLKEGCDMSSKLVYKDRKKSEQKERKNPRRQQESKPGFVVPKMPTKSPTHFRTSRSPLSHVQKAAVVHEPPKFSGKFKIVHIGHDEKQDGICDRRPKNGDIHREEPEWYTNPLDVVVASFDKKDVSSRHNMKPVVSHSFPRDEVIPAELGDLDQDLLFQSNNDNSVLQHNFTENEVVIVPQSSRLMKFFSQEDDPFSTDSECEVDPPNFARVNDGGGDAFLKDKPEETPLDIQNPVVGITTASFNIGYSGTCIVAADCTTSRLMKLFSKDEDTAEDHADHSLDGSFSPKHYKDSLELILNYLPTPGCDIVSKSNAAESANPDITLGDVEAGFSELSCGNLPGTDQLSGTFASVWTPDDCLNGTEISVDIDTQSMQLFNVANSSISESINDPLLLSPSKNGKQSILSHKVEVDDSVWHINDQDENIVYSDWKDSRASPGKDANLLGMQDLSLKVLQMEQDTWIGISTWDLPVASDGLFGNDLDVPPDNNELGIQDLPIKMLYLDRESFLHAEEDTMVGLSTWGLPLNCEEPDGQGCDANGNHKVDWYSCPDSHVEHSRDARHSIGNCTHLNRDDIYGVKMAIHKVQSDSKILTKPYLKAEFSHDREASGFEEVTPASAVAKVNLKEFPVKFHLPENCKSPEVIMGSCEAENLLFSPKTHFKPILETPTDSISNSTTANPSPDIAFEIPEDNTDSNYQKYLSKDLSVTGDTKSTGFVPKFRIHEDLNKSAQTEMSDRYFSNRPMNVLNHRLDDILEVIDSNEFDTEDNSDNINCDIVTNSNTCDIDKTVTIPNVWDDNGPHNIAVHEAKSNVWSCGSESDFHSFTSDGVVPAIDTLLKDAETVHWSPKSYEGSNSTVLPTVLHHMTGSYEVASALLPQMKREVSSVHGTELLPGVCNVPKELTRESLYSSPGHADDDVFLDDDAEFNAQMFPFEHGPPMPSTSEAMFSSDLEEKWKNSGKHFEVQVPRKEKSSSSSRRKPCSFFMDGNCRRSDCKYSHDFSKITCRFWEEGCCFKGITCPFLHGYTSDHDSTSSTGSANDIFLYENEDFPTLSSSKKKQDVQIKTTNMKEDQTSEQKTYLYSKTYRRRQLSNDKPIDKNYTKSKSIPIDIKAKKR